MDSFISLFGAWLGVFTISFNFLPILMVLDWKKRGSAAGFSSVNLVLPITIVSCWFRYAQLSNDQTGVIINSTSVAILACYLVAFAHYQPQRRYLYYQLSASLISLVLVFTYVSYQPHHLAASTMGSIAAGAQIVGLAGGIYEIFRAINLKHTEFINAPLQYGIFALSAQWLLFGILIGDKYMAIANIAGLAVNILTISLYFVYPPLYWRVPIIGTGPQLKEKKKDQ